MKLNKETPTKLAIKKTSAAGSAPRVPSVLDIAPAKPKVAVPETPALKAPSRATPIKVSAPKARSKMESLTMVQAKIDVGFGNVLFIRGHGDGLSWDKGTPLKCEDASTWVWTTKEAKGKVEFKLLINDEVWASGENVAVNPGETIETVPSFN